ncbi:Sphingomyelin phosphodiesterase 2, partial [Caligus rogercresseyi]
TPDNFILDVFTTHIHDSDPFYQNLQTSELMGFVFKSPADLLSTPEEHPYTSILNYKVINAAESFNPKDWSNPSLHGTFNMPDNPYSSPKDSKPKIVDYVFLGSPLKYDIQVHDFHRPSFSRGASNNVSLSNHEPIGVNIEVNA